MWYIKRKKQKIVKVIKRKVLTNQIKQLIN